MRIISTDVYGGPNRFAHFPCVLHVVDLEELEQWPTTRLGEPFIEGLLKAVPTLADHGCSYGEAGGFLRRMREGEGTWLGHVFEHTVLEVQHLAGHEVTFGKTRSIKQPGQYNVVFEIQDKDVGLEASRLALRLIHSLLPEELKKKYVDKDFNFEKERDWFIRYTQKKELGPSTGSLVKAAEMRGIPWLRLNEQSLVQLGHGKFQRRIQATITSETRHIAVELSCDKEMAHKIFEDLGLPVPKQMTASSERETLRAAERIGYPVVVKPYNGNHGRGVCINLRTPEEVARGYEVASKISRTVVVETFLTGFDHRMLVVNGELVAAAKRVPGHVIGDGTHSIKELIEIVNSDPRRGIGHEKVLTKIQLDHQVDDLLAKKGYTLDTVLPADEIFWLRSTANLSTGGTAIDVTDIVHPDNRAMAVRAAKAIGLDVCGVDFLTDDISQSYQTHGGGICEINAAPGFRMHVSPAEGKSRDVGGAVMDMLFPPGAPSRIPIACITGTNGKTTTSRMLAHILKMAGHTVGLTTTDGVYIDGKLTVKGDMTGPVAASMVLRDPTVDAAVLETARGGLLKRGMAVRDCDVAAVLNVQSDHLGLRGIDTLDELAEVKRTVVEIANDTAVLNADDPRVLRMAAYTRAKNVCYVTMNPRHTLVQAHIRASGRAVVLEQGMNGHMIALYDKGSHLPLMWTHLIPATIEGRALHNVQNAMFAAALAWGMKVSRENIEHGLRTFTTSFFQAPGRLNVFDEHPFKVIMDYAHNAHGVGAMANLTDQLNIVGRRIVVMAAPGDRRDEDILELAQAAAGHYDSYICKRDDHTRGRRGDEVPAMLRKGLLEHGVREDQIEIIEDEQEAITSALKRARPGDLVVVFADNIPRSWKQIIYFKPEVQAASERPNLSTAPTSVIGSLKGFEDYSEPQAMEIRQDERGVFLAREEAD
ncbi:MAG: cyanophycin synthetase [Xanthomonadales bacterium PRO6]|nr:Cyanophycin synthetase [Xanthomonadales bacterium]MCE7930946.1 cyanophycin synthetase [Xanthomonadales bacterium PRO6]